MQKELKFVAVAASLLFRASDKFFKFMSWAIIIAALKVTEKVTHSSVLGYVVVVAVFMFSMALLFQLLYLAARDPSTLGIPEQFRRWSRIVQCICAAVLLVVMVLPFSPPDAIIATIMAEKMKPH